MAQYILRRLAGMVFLLVVVSGITFLVFNVFPATDPAVLRAGRQPTPELIETIRQDLGLDRPWPVQFADYIYNVFAHLDFGRSYLTNQEVLQLILDDLPATISLAVGAIVIWLAIGLTVGVISATRRGTVMDRLVMGLSLVAISAPVYWLGPGHALHLRPRVRRRRAAVRRRAGVLRAAHRGPGAVVQVAHPALDRPRHVVRRDLRAPAARLADRRHGRGLHPHGARQGRAGNAR